MSLLSDHAPKETTIERAIVEDAAILTGIGIGTAFGLLAFLLIVIQLVHWFSVFVLTAGAERAARRSAAAEADAHDKALAAAIAVSAWLAGPALPEGVEDQGA